MESSTFSLPSLRYLLFNLQHSLKLALRFGKLSNVLLLNSTVLLLDNNEILLLVRSLLAESVGKIFRLRVKKTLSIVGVMVSDLFELGELLLEGIAFNFQQSGVVFELLLSDTLSVFEIEELF